VQTADPERKHDFQPIRALWLTLPSAIFFSVPTSLWLQSKFAPSVPLVIPSAQLISAPVLIALCLAFGVLLIGAPVGSLRAIDYCMSHTGGDGTRRALIGFNFLALLAMGILALGMIAEAWGNS
jgi:hypothetical protein